MTFAELSGLLAQGFGWIVRSSWQAGVLIVAVLLIQWLLRRQLSAGWRFSLWLLVVVRLVLPFSAESTLSVFNLAVQRPAVIAVPETRPADTAPHQVRSDAPAARNEAVKSDVLPAEVQREISPRPSEKSEPLSQPVMPDVPTLSRPTPERAPLTAWEIAAWVWLLGVIGLSAHVAVLMIDMARKVRRAMPVEDEAILGLFEECRRQMNVGARLSLLETGIVKSPALFGMFRHCLLLPLGMARSFSVTELRYIFLHELAHVKRRDVSLNWLLTTLQIVHWFNPLIWFGFVRMRADRELACDALAISSAGEGEAKAYGQTIIKLLETLSRPARRPGLVGIMEDKSQMARRITMIAHFKKRRRLSILALLIMAALAATGLTDAVKVTKAAEPAPSKEEPKETITITVVDADSGKPLSGASVVAPFHPNVRFNGPIPLQTADEAGRVIVTRSEMSSMGFGAQHPDYAPMAVTWSWSSREPMKAQPEIPKEYTVRLQRGVEIGGTVVDEAGRPVPNVRVDLKGMVFPRRETGEVTALEYPFFEAFLSEPPVTNSEGRWTCAHFPKGIEYLKFHFIRPDNSGVQFATERPPFFIGFAGKEVKMAEILAKTAVFTLEDGVDVRGVVVDAEGKPLAGITLKETDGRQYSQPPATIVTGADGRFELPNRDPHQILITATGPGYASNPAVVNIELGMQEVRIQMASAVPLQFRVVDETGKPLQKVQVIPMLKMDWKGETDAEGRIVWNDPPVEPQTYVFNAEGHGAVLRKLAPSEAEHVVSIRKGETPSVRVTVRAETDERKPLKSFTVSAISGQAIHSLGEGMGGVFEGDASFYQTGGREFRLKIEAPGFESFITEKLNGMSASEVAVTLRKAGPVQGVVLLPDGSPAIRAKVLTVKPDQSAFINLRHFGTTWDADSSSQVKKVTADSEGRFTLASDGGDQSVVVIHADGFAETTLSQLKKSPEVRLQAFGRIEGTFLLNAQPKKNVQLRLQPVRRPGYWLGVYTSADIETDKEGRFRSEELPPIEYTLFRSKESRGVSQQNHSFPVKVAAGETTKVTYDGRGRTITGHARFSAPYVDVDWEKDVSPQALTLRRTIEGEAPVFENYVRTEDYQAAYERWTAALASSSSVTYGLEFDAEGAFRIEGVPEGTYDLELGITKRGPERNRQEKPFASLKREIIVPPGSVDEPFNVGVLEILIQPDLIPRKPSPALSAKALDGQVIDLAQYRGKVVLVTFWAPWAKPSDVELKAWHEVSESFGTHPNVALLGVSPGEKPGVTNASPIAELNWIHTKLEGRDLAAATEAWGVDKLPTSFLISPEGWEIARDIPPARLRAILNDAIQQTKK